MIIIPPWRSIKRVSSLSRRFKPVSWHITRGYFCNLRPPKRSYCPSIIVLSKIKLSLLCSNLCSGSLLFAPQCKERRRTTLQLIVCLLEAYSLTFPSTQHVSTQYSPNFSTYSYTTLSNYQYPEQMHSRLQHQRSLDMRHWQIVRVPSYRLEWCARMD